MSIIVYHCILNFRCAICMCDFVLGESLRFLPCMHIYHKDCIDDWLMRAFTCPSCMEPVDAALLSSYQSNWPSVLVGCTWYTCSIHCDNVRRWQTLPLSSSSIRFLSSLIKVTVLFIPHCQVTSLN